MAHEPSEEVPSIEGAPTRRVAVTLGVFLLAVGLSLSGGMAAAAKPKPRISLIIEYSVAGNAGKPCAVYPNYPKEGVRGNGIGWTIAPGDTVGWRYNVNSTWAMISDKKYRRTSHPWWGFVERRCIGRSTGAKQFFPTLKRRYPAGRPIPARLREGRSAKEKDHYARVGFAPSSAPIVDRLKRACSKGTLRDKANNFVIGNVAAGWRTRLTAQHDRGWTKVYVPAAKRWGWLQDIHLRGC